MTTWLRRTGLPWSQVDDEIVLLDINTGNYWGLNRVAAFAWGLLNEPRTLEDLVSGVCEKYDVSHNECLRDMSALLENLVQHGFVEQRP